jgi:hypothetical protein
MTFLIIVVFNPKNKKTVQLKAETANSCSHNSLAGFIKRPQAVNKSALINDKIIELNQKMASRFSKIHINIPTTGHKINNQQLLPSINQLRSTTQQYKINLSRLSF